MTEFTKEERLDALNHLLREETYQYSNALTRRGEATRAVQLHQKKMIGYEAMIYRIQNHD